MKFTGFVTFRPSRYPSPSGQGAAVGTRGSARRSSNARAGFGTIVNTYAAPWNPGACHVPQGVLPRRREGLGAASACRFMPHPSRSRGSVNYCARHPLITRYASVKIVKARGRHEHQQRRLSEPPNSSQQPSSGRFAGPAAEPPWPNKTCAVSRRLQIAPVEAIVGAAAAAPLCRCEREAARS